MIKLRENYFFFSVICVLFVFGAYTFVKNENKVSEVENRTLATFQHFTVKDFLSGNFQSNFENALSDQFVASSDIRVAYESALASFPTFGVENALCENRYLSLSGSDGLSYATFNCEDYILRMPSALSTTKKKNLKQNIKNLIHLNSLTKAYYYVINNSSEYNFEKNELTVNYEDVFAGELVGQYGLDSLDCNDYETYKEYFYKTDLHWNYKGSYQGFLDIAKMLEIKDPAVPTGVFTNEEYYFGSYAKNTQKYDSLEKFTVYTFDIPEHVAIMDGTVGQKYSHVEEFVSHAYASSKVDFYAYAYGKNYGEIILDFDQPEKENLLIIADSFSNPLNELIAQYFNKTYVVDLRYYRNAMGKNFVLSEYLESNKIDKTLLIISSEFFITKANATKGLEK